MWLRSRALASSTSNFFRRWNVIVSFSTHHHILLHYGRYLMGVLVPFYLSLFLTTAIISRYNHYGDRETVVVGAPDFRPGAVNDLCASDAGAEKTVNFIETSGFKCLTPRQACAVESASLTNADMKIRVYMSLNTPPGKPENDVGEGLERHCRTMDVLKSMPNVEIVYEDLPKHLLDTPLESLYLSGAFDKSVYSYQHMSDALRIALIYKYGGIYLDLDVVVLRSLRCLKNTAGHVFDFGSTSIENDVLIFDRGHRLLKVFMRWMAQTYKPDERSVIGPNGFRKCFHLFCDVPEGNLHDYGETFTCYNGTEVTMMYPGAFHPIPYTDRGRFFAEGFPASELEALSNSFTVHVYTASHGSHVPPSSLYGFLAQRFCPRIYGESLTGIYKF